MSLPLPCAVTFSQLLLKPIIKPYIIDQGPTFGNYKKLITIVLRGIRVFRVDEFYGLHTDDPTNQPSPSVHLHREAGGHGRPAAEAAVRAPQGPHLHPDANDAGPPGGLPGPQTPPLRACGREPHARGTPGKEKTTRQWLLGYQFSSEQNTAPESQPSPRSSVKNIYNFVALHL